MSTHKEPIPNKVIPRVPTSTEEFSQTTENSFLGWKMGRRLSSEQRLVFFDRLWRNNILHGIDSDSDFHKERPLLWPVPFKLRQVSKLKYETWKGVGFMFIKIPKEKKEEILARVKAGEKVAALASQYGISDRTIYFWLRLDTKEEVVSLLKYNKLKRECEELKRLVGELTLDMSLGKKSWAS